MEYQGQDSGEIVSANDSFYPKAPELSRRNRAKMYLYVLLVLIVVYGVISIVDADTFQVDFVAGMQKAFFFADPAGRCRG